ncbi:MAG: ABC transporter permease subunit [Clostridia bacterium]|nr:ABC transporter permease subunit [Clostridia bacterium]
MDEMRASTFRKLNRRTVTTLKCTIAYILLGAAMVFSLLPIIWTLLTSVNGSNSLLGSSISNLLPKVFSLKNYEEILFGDGSNFITWFKNSMLVSGGTVFFSLTIGITAAYAYSRYDFISKRFTMKMFILLNAFPNIMALVAYYKILSVLSLANSLIGLIIIYSGGQLVFTIWNLKSYFDTIPYEIEESAYIDGASLFTILTKIILQLAKPAIVVTALFSFIAGWNEYVIAVTFNTSTDSFTLPVGLYSLQSAGDYSQDWPLFAAGSLVVAAPVMIIFLALQRSLVSGLTLGSSK